MPVSVSYSAKMLFEADFGSLDFSKVPADKLEAAKEYKRQKILSELLGDKGKPNDLRIFLENYGSNEKLGQFLFGEDFKLEQKVLSDDVIREKYNALNAQYKYEVSFDDYSKAVKACLYHAEVVEKNNNGNEVFTRAYKMLAMFGSMRKFDEFAKNFGDKYPNPVHDILQREIPEATGIDVPSWQKLIMKSGMDAVEGFEHANRIPKAPKDRRELDVKLGELSYPRAAENPEFAKLCRYYKVSEDVFNRTLDLIKDGTIKLKTNDNIPAVVVRAEELDASAKGVYLVKLPAGNMRGAILGKITDCCQSIGGESEQCVIDGLTRENNSFYVLLKAKKTNFDPSNIDWANLEQNADIAGQGYVWRAQSGNVVMDSWEGLGDRYDWLMPKLFQEFGKKLHEADPSINSFNIGQGGKTPASLKTTIAYAEAIKEGFMYGDSVIQSSVYVSDELKRKREELARRTGIADQIYILNNAIADKLLELTDEQLRKITVANTYKALTLPINIDWTVAHLDEIASLNSRLFESDAILIYQNGKASIHDLKDLPESKINLLVSYDALLAYDTGKVTFTELKDLPELEIWQKIGHAYLSSRFPNQDFLALESMNETSKIQLLISVQAMYAYSKGKVTFADLKDLPESKIQLLISRDVIDAYSKGKVTAADLKDLSESKIKLLISYSAIRAYETGKVTATDLKDLPESKINLLISSDVIDAYIEGKVTAADLKDLPESKIKLLISHEAIINLYRTGIVTASDLKDLSDLQIWQIIALATLSSAFPNQDFFEIGSVNEVSKIKLLISNEALLAYEIGAVTIAELKDLPESKIKLLISYETINAYITAKVTFADLKDFSEDSIKLLTSMDSCEKLKQGRSFAEIVNDNKSKFTSQADKILAKRILERQKGDLNK